MNFICIITKDISKSRPRYEYVAGYFYVILSVDSTLTKY
nr:MAG TPA: hypothetical protein [Caudoviricetes sp.]